MSEIQSGPTLKQPWEYQPGWAKELLSRFRPLFHAGVGGLKTLLDPRYTRPDRVRKNQEELEHQAKVTEQAQNKLRYWSDLKSLTRENNFINILKGIYTDQSHVIGKPPNRPSSAITDLEESTQMNKLYKTLFNKYLTEQTNNPTPIQLMRLGVGDRNYPVKTIYHPETGGESVFSNIGDTGISLTPPGAAHQDMTGTLLPMLAAEALGIFLTRGRIKKAMNARTDKLTKDIKRLQVAHKNVDEKLKSQYLDDVKKAEARYDKYKGYYDVKNPTLMQKTWRSELEHARGESLKQATTNYEKGLKQSEKSYLNAEHRRAVKTSKMSDDEILGNSGILTKIAQDPALALGVAVAGRSIYNSMVGDPKRDNKYLGLQDDDSNLNDWIPGVLGIAQSYMLAKGLRNALWQNRHLHRRLIGKENKNEPLWTKESRDEVHLGPGLASERAKHLLYREPNIRPGNTKYTPETGEFDKKEFDKFTKNGKANMQTRAYTEHPGHGYEAWMNKGPLEGRVRDKVNAIGSGAVDMSVGAANKNPLDVAGGAWNMTKKLGKSLLPWRDDSIFSPKGPGRAALATKVVAPIAAAGGLDLLKSTLGDQWGDKINPPRGTGTSIELGTFASKVDPIAKYEVTNKFGNVIGVDNSTMLYSQRRAGGILDKFIRGAYGKSWSDNRMLYLLQGDGRKGSRTRGRDSYDTEIGAIQADINDLSSIR